MKNLESAPAFSDIDQDDDGKLSAEEFAAYQSARRHRMMERRDP